MKKYLFIGLLILFNAPIIAQYLKTDGTNFMTRELKIRTDGFAALELESNTGAFIDFKHNQSVDYNGRIIWNFNASNRFDIYGEINIRNLITYQEGMQGGYLKLSNELQIPSSFDAGDPSIGLSDNTGFGINVHSTSGIGFALNNAHKMVILPSGFVGIGTTTPLAKLHVSNGNNSYGAILAQANESNFQLYTKTLDTQKEATTKVENGINIIESFRLGLKYNENENNGFISFYRGGGISGGYLGFSTNGGERIRILTNGNVAIGKSTADAKLDVAGTIKAEEIQVTLGSMLDLKLNGTLAANNITLTTNGQTADFVFESDYNLRNLSEVETFINTNKHLPDIPSAAQMEKQGVNLAEMNKLLLQKVEELTLYAIDLEKSDKEIIDGLEKQKVKMNERLAKMELMLDQLTVHHYRDFE